MCGWSHQVDVPLVILPSNNTEIQQNNIQNPQVNEPSNVKLYCPRCEDVYSPQSKYHSFFPIVIGAVEEEIVTNPFKCDIKPDVDGAYFGTTFPNLFLMTYGHLKPQKPTQIYVPRVFGFKVHKP